MVSLYSVIFPIDSTESITLKKHSVKSRIERLYNWNKNKWEHFIEINEAISMEELSRSENIKIYGCRFQHFCH